FSACLARVLLDAFFTIESMSGITYSCLELDLNICTPIKNIIPRATNTMWDGFIFDRGFVLSSCSIV
ncbi:hypothetical protein, partial [Vibrio sp. OPT46]|uniref:hypothetical protein n=1 Tax=Vibrio sp. OPT46 TaxID=2778645 RepID=UPI001D142489